MAAATTDLFTKVGLPGSATTLESPGFTIGGTTLNVASTANWQNETLQVFAIDQVTIEAGQEVRIAGSYREMEGIVTSATSIGSVVFSSGFSPRNYPAGSTTRVYIPVSSTRENKLIDGFKQDHNLKGNHKTLTDDNGNEWLERGSVASAVNQVKATNAIAGSAPIVEAAGDDANIALNLKSKGTSMVQVNGYEIDPRGSFQNSIINGACTIAQRTAPNISTTYQYGAIDRFAAKATGTAVSAGTISQTTAPTVTTVGYALKLSGVTVTGTGVVYVRYRMEAKDAMRYKNGAASFSFVIRHDVGSSINATVFINKANAADDFSATTAVANSGAISVPTATPTTVRFENINSGSMGDVSNGIEIEIQIACGAVTTKNFEFCDFQFNKGSKALPFFSRPVVDDLAACQRYFESCTAYLKFDLSGGGTATMGSFHCFATKKRVAPTLAMSNLSQTQYQNSSANTPTTSGFLFTGEILNGATIISRQSSATVTADAEL